MVQMRLVGGLNLGFEQSSGSVPAYKYACPDCGHHVAVVMKTNDEVIGITETSILKTSLRMVKSDFKDAELDIPVESELHVRIQRELLHLMQEASLKLFHQDWHPGIEIILFEEIFDMGIGKQLKTVDVEIRLKVKLLAESIGGWYINPKHWKNVGVKHPGFVTIIQWYQMYENRFEWFTK